MNYTLKEKFQVNMYFLCHDSRLSCYTVYGQTVNFKLLPIHRTISTICRAIFNKKKELHSKRKVNMYFFVTIQDYLVICGQTVIITFLICHQDLPFPTVCVSNLYMQI